MSWFRLRPGIQAGAHPPDFERLDEEGRAHRLSDYRGRWLLLFFYPQDNSPGCIREACRFNDDFEAFQELGADILGCSGQDAASHRVFRQACRLRYRLLSDPGRVLREAWQVPHFLRLIDGRCSYLIDPQGVLRWVHNDAGRPEEHSARALAFLKETV
jgi:peroxiredoxin Q/BCP